MHRLERSGPANDIGVRVIVGIKLAKAAIEIIIGVLVLSLATAGMAGELRTIVMAVRDHATEAWSIRLAEWVMNAATTQHLRVAAVASLLDGSFSCFEGWALHRRYRWSRWLVVGATASFFPFEIAAILRHFSVGRVALAVVNALIVVYLVWRSVGENQKGGR
jgi:uncharacterized membrane protein (DUF2068 family)